MDKERFSYPSLYSEMPYSVYEEAKGLPFEKCEIIAQQANLKDFSTLVRLKNKKPGEVLVGKLNDLGVRLKQYEQYYQIAMKSYYRPRSKIAILIANARYVHQTKLAAPAIDCDSITHQLMELGFIVVTLKNTRSEELRASLEKIFGMIEENSYCFIYYAGHGREYCNTRLLLGIDCPLDNMTEAHCVTENWIVHEASKCKLDLCVFIMDMCRIHLDRISNPHIGAIILNMPPLTMHKNVLLVYASQPCSAAYEFVEVLVSHTVNNDVTLELKSGDTDKIVVASSQYVNPLCTRLSERTDISSLLNKVHADVEQSKRTQRPVKVQSGTEKRSLHDSVAVDTTAVLAKLQELEQYSFCKVLVKSEC